MRAQPADPRGPRHLPSSSSTLPPVHAQTAPPSLRDPRANWWLRLTSWGWKHPYVGSLAQRERARRSRLAAWLILGLVVGVVVLSPLGYEDLRARAILAVWAAGLLAAAALNRHGWVTPAGLVLVGLFSGGILFANLASPIGLTMGELPNFDAYVVSVVLAATVLPRALVFLVAAGNSALIVGNYLWQPHNANLVHDAALYSSVTVQTISLLVRPIALQVVLAVVAYLWVRGAEEAIRRADRAEEIALLEHREQARTFALEEGVRYLHQVLSEWTAGDVRHRIPAMPVAVLEQVRHDLNTLIERLGPRMRTAFHLQRLQDEAQRLTAALELWVRGSPVVWPTASGTALDPVVALLRAATLSRSGVPFSPSPSFSASPAPPPLPAPPPSPTQLTQPTAPSPWPASATAPGGPAFTPDAQRRQEMPGRPGIGGANSGRPQPDEPPLPDWLRQQLSNQQFRQPADPLDLGYQSQWTPTIGPSDHADQGRQRPEPRQ